MFVNVGMWLERYVIIVVSLHRDFVPSSWGMYSGSIWDWGMFLGTMGLFLTLFFLFIRFLPMISIFEMRTMLPRRRCRRSTHEGASSVYGLLAEFADLNELVRATRATVDAGYRHVDAYTPVPVEEVSEILASTTTRSRCWSSSAGSWAASSASRSATGPRPSTTRSSSAAGPSTRGRRSCRSRSSARCSARPSPASSGSSACAACRCRTTRCSNVARFAQSSRDRFFLCVEATDPLFDGEGTRRFLERFAPRVISEVDH